MTVGERILERLNAVGMSQAELARRVSLAQTTINNLVRGDARSSSYLHKIARVLDTTVDYLAGETDDPAAGAPPAPTREQMAALLDLVPVAEVDQDYGMGGTFVADYIEEQIRLLPRHLVEAITQSPSSFLTIARGKGDSMEPTIRDQDMVIIDRSRKKLDEQDAIWALTVGGIGMIKRLRLRGRDVVIQSDNREVRDEIVNNEEVHLVGRVVFIGRNT
jgi:phage repressor protein C with HTH and peptisase S24 domain